MSLTTEESIHIYTVCLYYKQEANNYLQVGEKVALEGRCLSFSVADGARWLLVSPAVC